MRNPLRANQNTKMAAQYSQIHIDRIVTNNKDYAGRVAEDLMLRTRVLEKKSSGSKMICEEGLLEQDIREEGSALDHSWSTSRMT